MALSVLLLLTAAVVATASAQVPNPEDLDLDDPGHTSPDTDTEYTPVAKDTELWKRVAGAAFGEREVPSGGSPTPLSADLYAVSFRNLFNGFIGGDRCEDREADWAAAQTCTRIPVLYRYSQEAGRDGVIDEVYSAAGPGYVASIAWLGSDRALAVGGTGTYPRREPAAAEVNVSEDDPTGASVTLPEGDPAGDARVWLFNDGDWTELGPDEIPDGMGALTALDVSAEPATDCGPEATECAFVGGLRQIWRWEDGDFVKEPFTPTSVDEEGQPTVTHAADWRFRVRQLRFSPEGGPAAVAVTSGCCDLNSANEVAQVLVYDAVKGRWDVRLLYDGRQGATGKYQTLPDSYYALTFAGAARDQLSVLATPGGPERAGEPASRVVGPLFLGDARLDPTNATPAQAVSWATQLSTALHQNVTYATGVISNPGNSNIPYELVNPNLSSLRLAAGDGDVDGHAAAAPDGLMDWAVGVLRSTGQGIAYTTAARKRGPDPWLDQGCLNNASVQECQPDPDEPKDHMRSRAVFGLPAYALNGFQLIGDSGVGWAVGDKGAVVRLGGSGTVGSATPPPPPPALGSPKRVTPAASEPYDQVRQDAGGSGPPGPVPALAARPERELDSPRFLPAGSPDTRFADQSGLNGEGEVDEIVMSRDGTEGWAIGPGEVTGKKMTLYRYRGERWERCRMDEVPGVFKADPACAALAPLWKAGVRITAAARVPLERDSDPTNDDELEIVAAGSIYKDKDHPGDYVAMFKYEDGRWSIDWDAREEMRNSRPVTDIVFVRPNDGWLLAPTASHGMALYHFDSERWIDCNPSGLNQTQPECADAGDRIPFRAVHNVAPAHLTLAGDRLYLYGTRQVGADQANGQGNSPRFPFVLFKDPDAQWQSEGGGYDPGNDPNGPDPTKQGELYSLSVVQRGEGYAGWAVGRSRSDAENRVSGLLPSGDRSAQLSRRPIILQLDPAATAWDEADAAQVQRIGAYLPNSGAGEAPRLVSFVDVDGEVRTVFALSTASGGVRPLLTYEGDGGDGAWRVLSTPFTMAQRGGGTPPNPRGSFEGDIRALAPDGHGGLWMAAEGNLNAPSTNFYRWTDREPEPVFADVAHPIREPITSAAAGKDGRLWVTTASDRVHVYDRVTGWDSVRISGWDRGRVVTRTSHANAVAVGPDGAGVVAGENGRIAEIDPGAGVTLDPAARLLSTTHDLHTVAVAPDDGSALVGGDRRSVAWRPDGGEFHSIPEPPTSLAATITGISMPSSGQAWLVTDTGDIFSGNPAGGDWQLESLNADGASITATLDGKRTLALRAISVDTNGHGYAVGDDGIILERNPLGGATPWRRLDTGFLDDFQSLFYEPGGATLIGGESGLILTGRGQTFNVAHAADYYDPFSTAHAESFAAKTVAVTAASGPNGGVEAWALSQASDADRSRSPAPGRVLHHTSDDSDPLVSTGARVEPLPDAQSPDPDALSLAAFGKSDCHFDTGDAQTCPEPTGSNLANERVSDRVRDEILARSKQPGGPQLALFTGDVDQVAGPGTQSNFLNSPIDPSVVHHRWAELVGEPFAAEGVPLFGAIGSQDLSHTQACAQLAPVCASTHKTRTGPNLAWRAALAGMPAPWGGGGTTGDLTVLPVSDSDPTVEGTDVTVTDPTGAVGARTVPGAGAHTHYAFDVVRDGKSLARIAVLDTSLGSLAASDPIQNPLGSPQLKWLSDVLCRAPETTATGESCSREPGQRAIVVSNTPTYSFGPGALSDTQTDGTALEAVLSAAGVDLVVSGRMGWNAVYWSVAPGLHCPRAGDPQPDPNAPPSGPDCAAATGSEADALVADAQKTVGETVGGGGDEAGGALPFVIASSAGGKFGPDGSATGSANDGFWRGYTLIHLDPETGAISVEQRPVFDWVGIEAGKGATRVLRAGKKLELLGYGREPVGMDQPARYDAINSHAITHRYDLLVADPEKPWLPKEGTTADNCDPHDCLDGSIGTIDPTTGSVKAGNGSYPRTFAIAALSVGSMSAGYPLTFEPRASFSPPAPPPPRVPAPPAPPSNPPAPPEPTAPVVESIAPPVLPTLTAAQPPAPPTPPTPPAVSSQAPLNLNLAPTALDVTPPTAVSQPPTPPVNPAPPSGARREARQRQAAAQKSGADSAEEGSDVQDAGGDLAEDPNATGTAMTRHELTAITDREQPSAWARNALIGGGLGIGALVLAIGLRTARPTPRRREPELPAAALAHSRDRRRF